MVAISATASFFLYKGVKKAGVENAWLVVPFMLFQAFYFGVSRNAEVEPLAVAIICLAYYCYVSDKMFWFAILGTFLPLARLELSPALIIWAIILLKKKEYKYLPVLIALPVLWSIAGGIIEGNFKFTWLLDQVLNGEKSENIYGHKSFGRYFHSYPYVIGPVIFFLFFIGLAERLYKRKVDLFVVSQFILIFFIYVIFSWKLNAGNAAGFLRNLIPLTPLAAILSLNGFNYLLSALGVNKNKQENKPIQEDKIVNLNSKQVKYKKAVKTNSVVKEINTSRIKKNQKVRYVFFITIIFLLFYFYFSAELQDHHSFLEKNDYTNILVLLSVLFSLALIYILFRKDIQKVKSYSAFLVASFCIGFAVLSEHPDKNINTERKILEEASDLYVGSYMKDYKTYVNHIWFFWSNGLNRNDTSKFGLVTKNNLTNAPYLSFVFWENHYCSRLSGDVNFNWIQNNREFVELDFNFATDRTSAIHIFQKVHDNKDSIRKSFDSYFKGIGEKRASTLISRGTLMFERFSDYNAAILDLNEAIKIDSALPKAYYQRAVFYFNCTKDYNLALKDFSKYIEMDTVNIEALFNKGLCLGNLNRLDEAVSTYSTLLTRDVNYTNAYFRRGLVYYAQKKYDLVVDDLSKVLLVDQSNLEAVYYRALSYLNLKNFQNALGDFNQALFLNKNDVSIYYFRAKAFSGLGNYKNSIEDYSTMIAAVPGDPKLYFERGGNLMMLSDYRSAYYDFQHALNLGYPVPDSIISQCRKAGSL